MNDELKAGDVVQIAPDTGERSGNPDFAGLLMIVDEVKHWGVVCCCQIPEDAGQYYYRAANGEFERIGAARWPEGKRKKGK